MASVKCELTFNVQVVDFGEAAAVDGWGATDYTIDLTDPKPWTEVIALGDLSATIGQDLLVPSGNQIIRVPVLPVWETVSGVGDVTFTYGETISTPGTIDVVVSAPAEYAGTYSVDTTEIASAPQNEVAPALVTAEEPGDLAARNGLWFFDPDVNTDASITGRWVRADKVGTYTTRVPLRAASGLLYTSRDSYPQDFLADVANPPTWEERVESTASGSPVQTVYVAATAPATAVANPFASLIARGSSQWAYQDYSHIGGMFTDLAKTTAITGYGQQPYVVSDKSGNNRDANSGNASNHMFITLADGIIWDDSAQGTPAGRNLGGLSFNGLTEFTLCIALWQRNKTGGGTSPYGVILGRNGSSGLNQSGIFYQHSTNNFEFRLRTTTTAVIGTINTPAPTAEAPLVSVVTMRKTTTGVQTWLNGVPGPTSTATGTVQSDRDVGILDGGGDQHHEDAKTCGWLAAGFALSDTEIADMHEYFMILAGLS